MREIEPYLNGSNLSIGIVMSRFNLEVGEGLLAACIQELQRLGVKSDNITMATVPGALEIPLALNEMAVSEEYDALIAVGSVIRGETYHFEIVANESARGVNFVQLQTAIPIANAILTTEDEEQALLRMAQKGKEAAQTAVELSNLLNNISGD